MDNLLRFSDSTDQAKLKNIETWLRGWHLRRRPWPTGRKARVYSFSLPSGYACPFASECLSKADRITGKIKDGKDTAFRCFSASDEARRSSIRKQRWWNFDLLRRLDYDEIVDLLMQSFPRRCDIMRVHIGGDFFNQKYFDAWMEIARRHPAVMFYAYTKSIPYWVARLDSIPTNFVLNGSRGGRADNLLDAHGLKVAEVVFSMDEAGEKGLVVDHDESHAILDTGSFALLIHGTQPKGSDAGKAMQANKAAGVEFGYSRK